MGIKKIIYLSKKMDMYKAASYQQDVVNELGLQSSLFLYGPGYDEYDINDNIGKVIAKSGFIPDIIVMGHSWLSDVNGVEVDQHPNLKLINIDLPKIGILNKEYVNLNEKLNYLMVNKFDLCFSHHHEAELYQKRTDINFVFWPFAYNDNVFMPKNKLKKIDISFSGVLKNSNRGAMQSDIRIKIMNKAFYTLFDIPFKKRINYKSVDLFWNSQPRNKYANYLSLVIGVNRHLSDSDYADMMSNTKLYLNFLSPLGLISPRYFECMGSKTVVFCEESSLYSNIFDNNTYITFKSDLSDYEEKLKHYLANFSELQAISDRAYISVKAKHTWKNRIQDFLARVDKC